MGFLKNLIFDFRFNSYGWKSNSCRTLLMLSVMILWASPVVAKSPARIASLSLASDEILLELAPRCGGVEKIIALSAFVDDDKVSHVTKEAKSVKHRVHSEPESLLALKPDFVFAATFNRPELIKMIRAEKIPLLVLDRFSNSQDIVDNILKIAEVLGCRAEGLKLSESFLTKINSVKLLKGIKKPLLISYSQDQTVMAKDTLFDDLVNRAGGENIASKMGLVHWPKIESEELLKSNPDYVVILGEDSDIVRNSLRSHGTWKHMAAVKNGKFIFLDTKSTLSTSHHFANAVIELNRKLYGEKSN